MSVIDEWLVTVVPMAADLLLLVVALVMAGRLRRLQLRGGYQVMVLAVAVDAAVQTWQLWERLGQPAGVAWLVHAAMSYLAVYVLYRLSELLGQLRDSRDMRVAERQTVTEGGG